MGRHSRRQAAPEGHREHRGTPQPLPHQQPQAPAHGHADGHGGDAASARTRGGHPEQREPGDGWGADTLGRGAPTRAAAVPGPGHGPRQEYRDAFEASRPAASVGTLPPRREPPPSAVPDRAPLLPGPREGGTEEPVRRAAFGGATAAAVLTVLAVVVGGQVAAGGTGEDQPRETKAARGDVSDEASRSVRTKAAPEGGREPVVKPPTYAEKLGAVVPLDAELAGPDTFTAVGAPAKGAEGGQVMRYRVDVEDQLPLDGELFAETVHRTLNDRRSWAHDGRMSFQRVGAKEDADFVVTLASPGTTGTWCAKSGLDTTIQNVSCDSAVTDRVMINAYRWAQGSPTFGDDRIREYREMLVNHEVGHRIGHGHVDCAEDGALAPVMMQQTKTLTAPGGATCKPNAWPYPRG